MTHINIATHAPKTLEKLKEIAELSDGAIVNCEGYPTSLSIDIVNEGDVDIVIEMVKEKGLLIL